MANISPGVYTKIIDLSEYVQSVPSTVAFLPIISEKGPDNQLILTNARDFYVDFGLPDINYGKKAWGQGKYVAANFLRNSDSLYVIRVTDPTATFANLAIVGEDGTANYGVDGTSTASIYAGGIPDLNTEAEIRTWVNYDNNDATNNVAVLFTAIGRGAWYNGATSGYSINVTEHHVESKAAEGIYILDIYKKQSVADYTADTNLWHNDYEVVASYEVSFNPNKVDGSGASMFVEDVVNLYFRDIVVYADRDMCLQMCESGTDWAEAFTSATSGFALTEGSDGNTIVNAQTLLGQAYAGELPRIHNLPTGAYDSTGFVDEVLDTENYYFNIVLEAGYSNSVKTQIQHLVQQRSDCVALLDIGENRNYTDAAAARAQTYTYNDYRMALYDGYSKVYDVFGGRDIWLSPIYHMAAIVPYTDNVAELWYAPAGFNRASIGSIKELHYSPRQSERDQLYLAQINPIVKFNVGYTVWGQLTSQKRPTAMQDLNIVRLVLYIKRALEQFCKFYIFEMNDEQTWTAIRTNIEIFLKMIKDKRGLQSFTVDVGATDYEKKSKQIHVNCTLQPTRVTEKINLNLFIV